MRVLAFAGALTPAESLAGPNTAVFGHLRDVPELLCPRAETTIGKS